MLDNASAHTGKVSRAALAGRAVWLHPIWPARYSPHLNLKERERRSLKRDACSSLVGTLRGPAQAPNGRPLDKNGREEFAPPQDLRQIKLSRRYLAPVQQLFDLPILQH